MKTGSQKLVEYDKIIYELLEHDLSFTP